MRHGRAPPPRPERHRARRAGASSQYTPRPCRRRSPPPASPLSPASLPPRQTVAILSLPRGEVPAVAAEGAISYSRRAGEVPERSNGAVSKTVVPLTGDRGFESLPLRQFTHNSLRYLIRERFRLILYKVPA